LANKGKKPLTLEEKIKEHKAFLRDFQRLTGPEWVEQIGGIATIDRQLIMIDTLVTTVQAELQQNYMLTRRLRYCQLSERREELFGTEGRGE